MYRWPFVQRFALMAIDTEKYTADSERDARHSALLASTRDERRPAVLLLSALLLSALFFGIGLMVGRWTAEPDPGRDIVASTTMGSASTPAPTPAPAPSPVAKSASTDTATAPRRHSLLVATYDTEEKAQSLIRILEDSGYPEVRSSTPRAGDPRPRYS